MELAYMFRLETKIFSHRFCNSCNPTCSQFSCRSNCCIVGEFTVALVVETAAVDSITCCEAHKFSRISITMPLQIADICKVTK